MTKAFPAAALCAVLLLPALATAQPDDRVTFGGDVHVRKGEVVNDVVTMGGHARIDGEVLGDVVTMGGDAHIDGEVLGDVITTGGDLRVGPTAVVHGDLGSVGGEILVAEGGETLGERIEGGEAGLSVGPVLHRHHDGGGFGAWLADALEGLVSYALLFVLGLLLMGLARERLEALQVVIVRRPVKSLGMGLVGLLAALVTLVILCITILGIPAAILLAIALPFAIYVGLAASASVIGAALPVRRLSDQPVLQLAAGCAALWLASLVPFAGSVAVGVAALVGLGALVITRGRNVANIDSGSDPVPSGPYRTSVA